MKSCVYYYKNRLIGDIKRLDDFLLEKERFQPTLGDMVFSRTSKQLSSVSKIRALEERKVELDKIYNQAKEEARKAKMQGEDEEEYLRMKRPYVGVSEFLSGQRNENRKGPDGKGVLYFPEFIAQNYWAGRFHEWAKGNFTDDEVELFFDGDKSKITPVELGNVNDWRDSSGMYKETFGTKEQERLRDLMQDKWKHQAEYGSEIHNILQLYFSETKKSKEEKREDPTTWFSLIEGTNGQFYTNNFIKQLRDRKLISDITTDDIVLKTIEYAKQLRTELDTKFGDNLLYFPEITLSSELSKEYEGRDDLKLLGRIDLMVIDKNGVPHIIDYKTSPKPYEKYSSAKVLGFTYQLAAYERMLRRWGFNTTNTDIMVAPIEIVGFKKDGDNWKYDSIKKGISSSSSLESLTSKLSEPYLTNNLDDFMEAPLVTTGISEGVVEKVSNIMQKLFPKYGDNKKKTDEEIRELINEQNGFEINPTTGRYEFLPKGFKNPIYATEKEGEAVFFKRVKDYYTGNKERVIKKTGTIIKAIRDTKDNFELPPDIDDWVRIKLSKYASNEWEILDGDAADIAQQFGMILFHNRHSDLIEVVKISLSNLKYENNWGPNRSNLSGAHEVDITENSRSNSLMLKAVNGNIEMMEAMFVLNNIQFNKGIELGKIQVISPFSTSAMGITATNKELSYNWKKLMQISRNLKLDIKDNFSSGEIKLINTAEQCFQEFQEIMRRAHNPKYQNFEPALNSLQQALIPNNVEQTIKSLMDLKKILENQFQMDKDLDYKGQSIHSSMQEYDNQYNKTLYQMVNKALLELNGIDIRQSLKDHDKYLESWNVLTKGMSGTWTDNAGNFGNQMLNQITSLALEGYQNARDTASPRIMDLARRVEELKKDQGYTALKEYTVGNQTSLYDGMTYYDANGNLLFLNPWKDTRNLSLKQAEFLKYVILEINKDKHPDYSDAQIQESIKTDNLDFFQVPLLEGSFASKVNSEGWLQYTKNKFKTFYDIASNAKKREAYFKEAQSNFFREEDDRVDTEIFQVVNLMDQGNGTNRLDIITEKRAKYGDGFFEQDLERLLSSHIWAYTTKDALDSRMGLIKAAYISLAVMGNDQNYNFSNDQEFITKFAANRINHKSIVDEKNKPIKGMIGEVQQIASWMALAFAPVQMTGQSLEGIWKDAKLIITKPDGTEAFSLENMKKSAKTVYSELFHYSEVPTVTTGVNSLYGINDMDNASFAENNSSNKHGIFNFFGKMAYKFASRPDFYNRMTIFVAQMMQDGCWEAHSINPKTHQLEYDYKKDKRFRAYATNDKSNMEEYNKSKALYYTVAQQLVREGATKKDGSLFKIGDDLPKAYSNKESEARKAVGDTMYGYYDSTKKSLMQATMLGGLIMQMRTYWSAKKNQYLAKGGIKAQGKWVHAEQEFINPTTGKPEMKKLYYSKNEKGEIDIDGPLVTQDDANCSDVPFLQWQGKFEEGVLVTLWGMGMAMYNTSIKEGFDSYWNNIDENLRQTYQANLKLLVTDLVMWSIIGGAAVLAGDWADDEYAKSKKSGKFEDAMYATWANLVYRTIKYSSLDFAWWNAIFEVSMDWNPFSISYIANEFNNIGRFITGDDSFADTMVKSFSAARQLRPMFTFIDQEEA